MKLRNGFVSNSSSSSFVLAYKKSQPCPHCGRTDPDMYELLRSKDNSDCESTSVESKGKIRTLSYIKKQWYDYQDDDKLYNKLKEKIQELGEQWEVISGRISYHDDMAHKLVSSAVKRGNVKILAGEIDV